MVIVITGPTATGKTDLGIFLAKKLNGEIINCDSTQIYKGMDIATNKVKDTEGVVHHLFDFLDIDKDYSVYDYQKDARRCIADILSRGKVTIFVGGTGLYIKAALYDYEFNNDENNQYEGISNEKLYKKLLKVDPDTSIHLNNRVRVIRALNYYKSCGKPYSLKEKKDKLLYDTLFIGLTTDRDILYDKINKRVDKMIEEGLMDEAKSLYDSNVRTKAVMTPIGYKELFEYFSFNKSLEDRIDLIKKRSRHYAKRQYTWFNHQMDLKWFDVNYDNFLETENNVLKYILSFSNLGKK
ncbi:MAG: tRNA (adenosine(37)-N6)-dimethylallyltransferase MiaA [Bacilli bacterium]|nr:tRNA (adenosine(37)-N6)-dimethylallyltransferase MiaA [Bacilli bacterium]